MESFHAVGMKIKPLDFQWLPMRHPGYMYFRELAEYVYVCMHIALFLCLILSLRQINPNIPTPKLLLAMIKV